MQPGVCTICKVGNREPIKNVTSTVILRLNENETHLFDVNEFHELVDLLLAE